MNDVFEKTLHFVLNEEGGFVNDPDDPGGATNRGITQKTYDAYLRAHNRPVRSVKFVSELEAAEIYFKNYYLAAKCDKMSPKFAALAFDTAVNMGLSRVGEFMKASNWVSIEKFVLARIKKYTELAKSPSLRKFFYGWVCRVIRLYAFVCRL